MVIKPELDSEFNRGAISYRRYNPPHHLARPTMLIAAGLPGAYTLLGLLSSERIQKLSPLTIFVPDVLNRAWPRAFGQAYNLTRTPLSSMQQKIVKRFKTVNPKFRRHFKKHGFTIFLEEQFRPIEAALDAGFPIEQIVFQEVTNKLLLRLINQYDIKDVLVNGFGMWISSKVNEAATVKICHPGLAQYASDGKCLINLNKGKYVWRNLANLQSSIGGPASAVYYLIDWNVRMDAGSIRRWSSDYPLPYFNSKERGPKYKKYRIRRVMAGMAPLSGSLIRYGWLPEIFSLKELAPEFYYKQLAKMGFEYDKLNEPEVFALIRRDL